MKFRYEIIVFIILIILIIVFGMIALNNCKNNPPCETMATIEYISTTKYINTTITKTEYINTTEECVCPNAAYMSRLLRDYERCNAEMKYFNETDLKDLSYDLNVSLARCNEKVEKLKDLI